MTTLKVLNASDCARKIEQIGRVGKALQNQIHLVAVSCLDHIREHGNTTLATRLLTVLPNGQRVKALAAWFSAMSSKKAKFVFDKNSKLWVCNLEKARTDEDFKMQDAMETSFADLTEEREPKAMTLDQFIKSLQRTADNDEVMPNGEPKVPETVRNLAASLAKEARERIQIAA